MQVPSSTKTFVFVISIASVALALCTSHVQARSLDDIKASGEIRLCLYGNDMTEDRLYLLGAAPSGCRDDCTFEGISYDTALIFAKTLAPEIKARFVRVGWDEQFHNTEGKTDREEIYTPALLDSGTCDIYVTGMFDGSSEANLG